MKMTRSLLTFSFFAIAQLAFCQRNVKDSIIATPWCAVNYGAIWTSADLADRYGYLNHLGVNIGYKTAKNWVYLFWMVILFSGEISESQMYWPTFVIQKVILRPKWFCSRRIFIFKRIQRQLCLRKGYPRSKSK